MSIERPLQTKQDFDPNHQDTGEVPNHVPEYTERTDTIEPAQDRRRLGWAVKLGVPAAALALTAGVVFGNRLFASHENPDAGKTGDRPTATGPAVPGQTHEASPSAQSYNPNDYHTWSANHVPLEVIGVDGKVDNFDSVKAYSESLMIPGASLEEISKNPQHYADQLLASVNSYLNAVNNPDAASKYADVPPTDANSYTGIGAVLDQYVKPGFEQAVVGEPQKSAEILSTDNTQEWLATLNKTAHNISHFKIVTKGQYDGKWELSPKTANSPETGYPVGYTVYNPNTDTIHIYMNVNFVDNMDQTSLAGQQNADGSTVQSLDTAQVWNMEVQQQDVGGKQVLRIVSISADKKTM